MDTVIRIIGTVIVLLALVYLIRPDLLQKIMRFFKKGYWLYFAALVRFALGVVFLMGAMACDVTWLITVLGILFLVSGFLIIALGRQKVREILDWYLAQPLLVLRILAVLVLAVGLVIVYAA